MRPFWKFSRSPRSATLRVAALPTEWSSGEPMCVSSATASSCTRASFPNSSASRTMCARWWPDRHAEWPASITRTCRAATSSSATGWRRCSARCKLNSLARALHLARPRWARFSLQVRFARADPCTSGIRMIMTRRRQQREHGTTQIPSQRQLRVGELVRHALADMLTRGAVHDPVIQNHLITVPEVRMTADLRLATIYVMPLGGRDADAVLAALERNKRFLRGEIAREINLKFAPEIRFRIDERFDEVERIEKLLRTPAVQRDLDNKPDDDN